MKSKTEEDKVDESKARVYEVGYLLVPTIANEEVSDKVGSIRKVIESAGCKILDEGGPTLHDLAYEMSIIVSNKKETYNSGYFGWIKFEDSAVSIETIQDKLKKDAEIIRFIAIKTVREDTLAVIEKVLAAESEEKIKVATKEKEKMVESRREVVKKKEIVKPASKEEIDETIEKLIIE